MLIHTHVPGLLEGTAPDGRPVTIVLRAVSHITPSKRGQRDITVFHTINRVVVEVDAPYADIIQMFTECAAKGIITTPDTPTSSWEDGVPAGIRGD